MTDKPIAPRGINHLVLNVHNLEESHRFWTEIVGFRQVGELKPAPHRPVDTKMRFYSAAGHHHDLALVENPSLPPPPAEWSMFGMPLAINHVAITYPGREAWLSQLRYLQDKGVTFDRRVEHGMTHSVYIHDPNGYGVELLYDLPRETWEGDVDAALNYAEILPTQGADALNDRVDVPVFQGDETTAQKGNSGMGQRVSVNGARSRHENPIPNASRIGRIVMSSVITGANPGTRDLPDSFEAQVANVFTHIRHDVEAAGGTVDDILKITFWVRDPATQRSALNAGWVELFPNPESRPARHTQPLAAGGKSLVQADFVAVLGSNEQEV